MITVIIKDSGEANVIRLTYSNLWKELKDIEGSEIIVDEDWFRPLDRIRNPYVVFMEADGLMNSGYFASQLGLLKKNPMFRKIAVMSAATGVNQWGNKFFGYKLGETERDGIIPERHQKARIPYPVQVAYIPGAIIRMTMLKKFLEDANPPKSIQEDLVYMSAVFSLGFWRQGIGNGVGNRVHLNPTATYVTTEDYVNDIGAFDPEADDLKETFKRQAI